MEIKQRIKGIVEWDHTSKHYVIYQATKKDESSYEGIGLIKNTFISNTTMLNISDYINITWYDQNALIKLNKGFVYVYDNKPAFRGSITIYQ